jgi:hypothetical protein
MAGILGVVPIDLDLFQIYPHTRIALDTTTLWHGYTAREAVGISIRCFILFFFFLCVSFFFFFCFFSGSMLFKVPPSLFLLLSFTHLLPLLCSASFQQNFLFSFSYFFCFLSPVYASSIGLNETSTLAFQSGESLIDGLLADYLVDIVSHFPPVYPLHATELLFCWFVPVFISSMNFRNYCFD